MTLFFNPISESWIYKLYKQKTMKTAMQELRESLQSINERYELKGDSNWLMNEVLDLVDNSLEKEKEQIIDAHLNGQSEFDMLQFRHINKTLSDNYFNQKYNQKQHIIDIMKADEDDGLYNQNI
jgi:hypothetical protein